MKCITIAAYKGGCGKSTSAASLCAALTQFKTAEGARLKPVWVWADLYGTTDMARAAVSSVFGPEDDRKAPWLADRGFYAVLRGDVGRFAQSLEERGTLNQHAFVFDTGAQLVADAARYFVPRSQVVLLPFNRSSVSDGSSKLLDTIEHLQFPDPDGDRDPEASAKIRCFFTQLPHDEKSRAALLRKKDMQDMLSIPAVYDRLMDNCVYGSPMLADMASPRQQVTVQTLRGAIRLMQPFAQEVVQLAGWSDLVFDPVVESDEMRAYLRTEVENLR